MDVSELMYVAFQDNHLGVTRVFISNIFHSFVSNLHIFMKITWSAVFN